MLSAFSSFKLEEPRIASASKSTSQEAKDVDLDATKELMMEIYESAKKSEHFFAKFLTNPKLLALQLSDSNFRRSVLVQFLILFQYLQLTVKFKTLAIFLCVILV